MCFEYDSRPPPLPRDLARPSAAGGAKAELLELSSADGTRFSAALAGAPDSREPGVVILPDVRGLYPFYVELAERFAQAGHSAIAIDYFGRTAGIGMRDEDFDYSPHIAETRVEQIQADAAAARDALRERTGASSTLPVGFCFGGSQAYMTATNPELGFVGTVAFYGALVARRAGAPTVLEHVGDMRGPILGLFGGADQAIPPEQVEQFDRGLSEAGVEHEIVTYPGAPHSFFDRKQEQYAEESDDAWRRVIGFLERS